MTSWRQIAGAVLAGFALVTLLMVLRQRAPEAPREVLLEEPILVPTPTLEPLPDLLAPTPTPEIRLSDAERTRMQREFLALARYQRRALEKVYLDTLQNIYLLEPDYAAQAEADLNWPGEVFDLDFEAFRRQRAQCGPVLDGSAAEIHAWLEDLSGLFAGEVRDAIQGDPAFSRAEQRIREDFGTLDRLIDDFGASLVQDATAADVFRGSFPNIGVQLNSDKKSTPPPTHREGLENLSKEMSD